mmetsp:Transcript_12314/g.36350  ORF Transcript_12314/g.36350 Transcript_12314/m.36350 type:complete len:281 (-) Transcript_12314:330-1172(-)
MSTSLCTAWPQWMRMAASVNTALRAVNTYAARGCSVADTAASAFTADSTFSWTRMGSTGPKISRFRSSHAGAGSRMMVGATYRSSGSTSPPAMTVPPWEFSSAWTRIAASVLTMRAKAGDVRGLSPYASFRQARRAVMKGSFAARVTRTWFTEMHVCPALKNRPWTTRRAAMVKFTVSSMIAGAFPPSSRVHGVPDSAHAWRTTEPTASDPVKKHVPQRRPRSALPTSGPPSITATPSQASPKRRASNAEVAGVFSDGLMTTTLPVTSASIAGTSARHIG